MAETGSARLLLSRGLGESQPERVYNRWNDCVRFDDPSASLPTEIMCLPVFKDVPSAIPHGTNGLVLTVPAGPNKDCWRLGIFNFSETAWPDAPELDLVLR